MTSDEKKSVKEKKPAAIVFQTAIVCFFMDTHPQQLSLHHNHTDA